MKVFETLCPWLTEHLDALEQAALAERLGHGWLISGPRDIGKRNLAYVLADRLLNQKLGQPAPPAATPQNIVAGYEALTAAIDLHPDLHRLRVEEDKKSIVVDQIREISATLTLKPLIAGIKLVVIETAELMTNGAANALLKSLEEPTPNTYLLLLAERPGRLPATIRSRCQHIALKAPALQSTVEWLELAGSTDASQIPAGLAARAPLAAARAICDEDNLNNYNKLYSDINAIYEGKIDPFTVAERWQSQDPELALSCLVDSLQSRIRRRLVPERWNPVTDSSADLADNSGSGIGAEALFERLKMAENLREQLGRGLNVELALKALLLGLEQSEMNRVST